MAASHELLRTKHLRKALVVVGAAALSSLALTQPQTKTTEKLSSEIPSTHLPKKVGNQAISTVKMVNGPEASGVKIAPNLVLTVGHSIGDRIAPDRKHCGGRSFIQTKADKTPLEVSRVRSWVAQVTLHNFATPDVAIEQVNPSQGFQNIPAATLAKTSVTPGSLLYFSGYGTNQRHEHRYPNHALADSYQGQDAPRNLGSSANYAGIVLRQAGPYIVAATGVRGYNLGASNTANSSQGDSGGLAANEDGQLIGVVADETSPGSFTVAQLEQKYRINLHLSVQTRLAKTFVTAVTQETVQQFEQKLEQGSPCPLPPNL